MVYLVFFLLGITSYGQSVKGYRFSEYLSKNTSVKTKAKIDFTSYEVDKKFKNEIFNQYKKGKVNFASFYIICTWSCGAGCSGGVMVDVRTGRIYKLPMGEDRNYVGCVFDKGENFIEFSLNSRLFITQICEQNKKTFKNDIQEKEYFINIWNEDKKNFILIDNIKFMKLVNAD